MNYFDFLQMNREALIAYLKKLSRAYAPEWQFDEEASDSGTALALIYADMLGEVIEKITLLPRKHYTDMLNLFDPIQMPSKGASGYVAFELSEGTTEKIPLFKGHVVIADGEAGDSLYYEAVEDVLLLPAKLLGGYRYISEGRVLNAVNLTAGFTPFAAGSAENLQHYAVTFHDSKLLQLSALQSLEVSLCLPADLKRLEAYLQVLADPSYSTWWYWQNDAWQAFESIQLKDGKLILSNKEATSLHLPDIRLTLHTAMAITCDAVKFNPRSEALTAIRLFENDNEIESLPAYMFGEQFNPHDVFYIGSEEAFNKGGSRITLTMQLMQEAKNLLFEVPQPPIRWRNVMRKNELAATPEREITIERYALEYWNGMGWAKISTEVHAAALFSEHIEGVVTRQLSFQCPSDFSPTYVGAYESLWLRIRILNVANAYTPKGYYLTPKLRNISLSFDFGDRGCAPSKVIRNAFMEVAESDASLSPVVLFEANEDLEVNALYLKCSNPLVGSPIKLLFDIERGDQGDYRHALTWQLGTLENGIRQWKDIEVIDGTLGLNRSGLVTLLQKASHESVVLFSESGYWLRILQKQKAPTGEIVGIYLNGTLVFQRETQEVQYHTLNGYDYHKRIDLGYENITAVEVWIDEGEAGLLAEDVESEVVQNRDGELAQCWIKWHACENFRAMHSDTRGYIVDLYRGVIQFGNGIYGYLPQGNRQNNVRIQFSTNKGIAGNVSSHQISRLGKALSNVNRVSNPMPTYGGQEVESKSNTLNRTASAIRHLNRVRAYGDLNDLVLSADFDIAEVKTRYQRNAQGMNIVTSYVHPKQPVEVLAYFEALREQIKAVVLPKLPCTMAYGINYFVEMPLYVIMDVKVQAVIRDINAYLRIEREIREVLDRYLDTFKGNRDRMGWHFGEYPDRNTLLNRLYGIAGVDQVEHLIFQPMAADRSPMAERMLRELSHFIIVNGEHDVALSQGGF